MKKLLPFLLIFFVHNYFAQIVFCPPGAQWQYQFVGLSGYNLPSNFVYTGDTVINSTSAKVLSYQKFYKKNAGSPCTMKIFIKQNADTVFFRNCNTYDKWQVLYNFAATTGQSWQTTVVDTGTYGSHISVTHTITVNAVTTITLNNTPLKMFSVTYCYINYAGTLQCESARIIERIGAIPYLFNYFNHPTVSDWEYLKCFTTYKDNAFGVMDYDNISPQLTEDFHNPFCSLVGIDELSAGLGIKVYPNPASDIVNVSYSGSQPLLLQLTDALGRIVHESTIHPGEKATVSMETVAPGLYLLNAYDGSMRVYQTKVNCIK